VSVLVLESCRIAASSALARCSPQPAVHPWTEPYAAVAHHFGPHDARLETPLRRLTQRTRRRRLDGAYARRGPVWGLGLIRQGHATTSRRPPRRWNIAEWLRRLVLPA
jgi:hypothetical protein